MIASFADPGQKTTPAPFGHALVAAAQADDRIVGLTADLGKYTGGLGRPSNASSRA